VVAGAALGATLAFLDGTLVHVALPSLAEDLGADFGALQWVVDGYLLTLGALLLLGGALGDLLGRDRALRAGIVAFAVASLGCGLAPSAGALIVARVLQGVAAALLVPGSLALLSSVFRGGARAEAIGIWSAASALTTGGGPLLGGWIVSAASWRWAFFVNLPVAAAALWALRSAPPTGRDADRRLDVQGAGLAVAGLGGLCFGLIEGPEHPLAGALAAGVGLLALGAFVQRVRAVEHAMIPPDIFRSRAFVEANLLTAAVYFALSGTVFLAMLRLQYGLGLSALEAGLGLLPFTLAVAGLSRWAGRRSAQGETRALLGGGPLLAALGIVGLAALEPGERIWIRLLPAMSLVGLGMAAVVAPLTSAVFAAASPERAGAASGINNAVSRVAGLLAVAALPLLGGGRAEPEADLLATTQAGLLGAAAVMAAAGVAAAQARALHGVTSEE
jgi:EmrB/QacA subfamily drug resistance transporter